MDNVAIARALTDLADLKELNGADAFRLRAFRNAARAIEGISENVADLARDGKLEEVRGIGGGVAKRISELLETGKIAETEELRAALPPGLVDLMNLPG